MTTARATPGPAGHPGPGQQGQRRWLLWAAWLTGVAALAIVIWLAERRSEATELARLLRHAALPWLALAAALQLATYALQGEAWREFLARARARVPRVALLGLSVAKLFMDQVVPSAGVSGTVVMVQGLQRRRVGSRVPAAGVVVETVTYYVGYCLCILAAILVAFVAGYRGLPVLLAFAVVVGLTAALGWVMIRIARGDSLRLPHPLERIPGLRSLRQTMESSRADLLRDARVLLAVTAWQIGIHLADAATIWALLQALGTPVSPVAAFASFMLASLARTVGIVPGGLGTFEAVAITTLRAGGAPLSAALAATLMFRALSFWLPMLPGWWLTHAELRRAARRRT